MSVFSKRALDFSCSVRLKQQQTKTEPLRWPLWEQRQQDQKCRLVGVGGLRVVEVVGSAVGVVVRHVAGGAVQVEVASAGAVGGEAADWAASPAQKQTHSAN